jgi:hypothetical protein
MGTRRQPGGYPSMKTLIRLAFINSAMDQFFCSLSLTFNCLLLTGESDRVIRFNYQLIWRH